MDSKYRRAFIKNGLASGRTYGDLMRELHGTGQPQRNNPSAFGGQQYMQRLPAPVYQGNDHEQFMDRRRAPVFQGDPTQLLQKLADGGPVMADYSDSVVSTVPPAPEMSRYERMRKAQQYRLRGMEPPADLMPTEADMAQADATRQRYADTAGLAASAMVPLPMRAIGAAYRAAPIPTVAGLGGLGLSATSSEAGGDSTFDKQMMDFTRQEAETSQRVKRLEDEYRALVNKRTSEEKGGRGPRWREADNQVRGWEAANQSILERERGTLEALANRRAAFEAENSPAALRERFAKAPLKEAFPLETGLTQAGLIAAGLVGSAAMKGRNQATYNRTMQALDAQRNTAVARANRARDRGDMGAAGRLTDEASRLTDDIATKSAKGPDKLMTVAPAIAGLEAAAFGPTVIDYMRSKDENDPRYQTFINTMTGGEYFPGQNLLGRAAGAATLGYAGAKLMGAPIVAYMGRYQPGSAAAADALAAEGRGEIRPLVTGFTDSAVANARQEAKALRAFDRRDTLRETGVENRENAVQRRALAAARRQVEQDVAQQLAKLTPAERAAIRSRQLGLPDPAQSQTRLPQSTATSPNQQSPNPPKAKNNQPPIVPPSAGTVNLDADQMKAALNAVAGPTQARLKADPTAADRKLRSIISMQTGKPWAQISEDEMNAARSIFGEWASGKADGGSVSRAKRAMSKHWEKQNRYARGGTVHRKGMWKKGMREG